MIPGLSATKRALILADEDSMRQSNSGCCVLSLTQILYYSSRLISTE